MLGLRASAERIDEVGWVTDYLADLEADFLVYYGIDDMEDMPGPKFFRLATRAVAYAGVMQARAQALVDAEESTDGPTRTPSQPTSASSGDVKVIEPTREALASSAFAGLIEMG